MTKLTVPARVPVEPTIPENIKRELLLDAAHTGLLSENIDKYGEAGRLQNGTTLSLIEGTLQHAELNEITAPLGVEILERIQPSVMRGVLKEKGLSAYTV